MLSLESPLDILNYKGFIELFQIKDKFDKINKIKIENINNIIKNLFDKKNLNIFIHGNYGN